MGPAVQNCIEVMRSHIYNGMFKICRTKTKAQFNRLLVLRFIRFDLNRCTTIKTGTTINRHVALMHG